MEMMGRVRRMKLRDGMSNSEIAKRTGLSRNTVKKWLKAAGDEVPKYKRSSGKATKLSAYEDTVFAALKADAHRPKEHRRTARALFAQIQAQGYQGGYPLAVLLDIYDHGGVVYSVTGHGMQCRWDTTRGGAIWVPDEDAEDNIRSNVLRELGVGEVCWSGTAGGRGDPPAVHYSLDGGTTWIGGYATRTQAMAALVEASGLDVPPSRVVAKLAEEAERYCRGVLDEYNAWVNGEVYGIVVYVVDRATGRRVEDRDEECWGYVGSEYAEQTLEYTLLNTVMHLGAAVH